MPQGPRGLPRLTNFGPLSRSTEEEIRDKWRPCPRSGKPREICTEIKLAALNVLEGQGIYPECEDLAEINSGGCVSIAKHTFQNVEGVRVYDVGYGDHVWIYYNGKHYDAEVPSGVEDPLTLPFFERLSPDFLLPKIQRRADGKGDGVPDNMHQAIRDVTEEKNW